MMEGSRTTAIEFDRVFQVSYQGRREPLRGVVRFVVALARFAHAQAFVFGRGMQAAHRVRERRAIGGRASQAGAGLGHHARALARQRGDDRLAGCQVALHLARHGGGHRRVVHQRHQQHLCLRQDGGHLFGWETAGQHHVVQATRRHLLGEPGAALAAADEDEAQFGLLAQDLGGVEHAVQRLRRAEIAGEDDVESLGQRQGAGSGTGRQLGLRRVGVHAHRQRGRRQLAHRRHEAGRLHQHQILARIDPAHHGGDAGQRARMADVARGLQALRPEVLHPGHQRAALEARQRHRADCLQQRRRGVDEDHVVARPAQAPGAKERRAEHEGQVIRDQAQRRAFAARHQGHAVDIDGAKALHSSGRGAVTLEDGPGRVVGLPGEHADLVARLVQRLRDIVDAERLGPEMLAEDEDLHDAASCSPRATQSARGCCIGSAGSAWPRKRRTARAIDTAESGSKVCAGTQTSRT